jgi:hypothetical protein
MIFNEPAEAAKWFREGVHLREKAGRAREADLLWAAAAAAVGTP